MADTDDRATLRAFTLRKALEREAYVQAHQHAIILNGEDADLYFSDAMTPAERRAVSAFLVHLGKATWVIPRAEIGPGPIG